MKNFAVIGTQWGDEGKGKIVDWLAQQRQVAAIARYQGGNNAGHTVVVGGEKYAFHLLPSGILYKDKQCLIGNGVILDLVVLVRELRQLQKRVGSGFGRILISEKAHLILPWHTIRDGISGGKIGTTGKGIGPTYTDFVARRGIRIMDMESRKWFRKRVAEEVRWNKRLIKALCDEHALTMSQRRTLRIGACLRVDSIVNTYWRLMAALKNNPRVRIGNVTEALAAIDEKGAGVVFEGAQATLLDISHGTYPFVTSSHPTLGGLYAGVGYRPRGLKVIGVTKAYTTRVGEGGFPTELTDEVGEQLRKIGHEYGTTTGRPRRCGWLDIPMLQYAVKVNGLDELAMTKLDVLSGLTRLKIAVDYTFEGKKLRSFPVHEKVLAQAKVGYAELQGWKEDITGVRKFGDLPKAARAYVEFVEKRVGVPVKFIGVGPGRKELVRR